MSDDEGIELRWPAKYDASGRRREVSVHPDASRFRCHERHGGSGEDGRLGNRVYLGDNLAAMQSMLSTFEGRVDLVYLDPPFCTGGRFTVGRRIGDDPTSAPVELPAYDDRFEGGAAGLLAMLDDRLRLVHRLLAPHGSVYVHVDPTVGHAVKLMLDEIFGPRCFQREIVWRIGWLSGFKTRARNWIRNHDLIFFYTKDPSQFRFNKHYTPYPEGYVRRDGKPPTGKGVPLEDVWNANEAEFALTAGASLDSIQIKSFSREKTGWATQKNTALLRRIIEASSDPGDLVLDPFGGSGTTATVAAKLGRRFLHCDRSPIAHEITRGRLLDAGCAFETHGVDAEGSTVEAGGSAIDVRVDREAGVIELVGLEPHEHTRRSLADAGAAESSITGESLDLVQAWCVAWTPGEPFTVEATAHRTLRRRTLRASFEVPERARVARVRVYDVLGRVYRRDLRW